MGDEDDFTFCKVAPPLDVVEAQNFADGIREISIEDGNGNSVSSNPKSGTIWRDGVSSQKQETVGSLSFSVMDASSSCKDVDQRPKLVAQEGAGSSTDILPEKKAPAKKSASRAKVPFEKGYSQMDWLKLTRTHPDLAGLKGQSNKRLLTLSEVKQHQSEGSMWTVLKGRVYNIAPYLKFHPGGVDILMKAVGRDCTSLFNKYHAWVNAEFLLEKCLVGILDEGSK